MESIKSCRHSRWYKNLHEVATFLEVYNLHSGLQPTQVCTTANLCRDLQLLQRSTPMENLHRDLKFLLRVCFTDNPRKVYTTVNLQGGMYNCMEVCNILGGLKLLEVGNLLRGLHLCRSLQPPWRRFAPRQTSTKICNAANHHEVCNILKGLHFCNSLQRSANSFYNLYKPVNYIPLGVKMLFQIK